MPEDIAALKAALEDERARREAAEARADAAWQRQIHGYEPSREAWHVYYVLQKCTDEILAGMWATRDRWYYLHGLTPRSINGGWCHEWAELVCQKMPEARHWMYGSRDNGHSFIEISGRFYDAELLEGAADWCDIPLFQRFHPELIASLRRNREQEARPLPDKRLQTETSAPTEPAGGSPSR